VAALLLSFWLASKTALTEAGEAKLSGQGEWEKTLQAAKEEGQLVLYHAGDYELVFAEFHKKYPEIKVTDWRGLGPAMIPRIMAERRGGKYLADVLILGATSGFTVYMINQRPHPNAAKVAANWLLSRDGQMAAQRIIVTDKAEWMDMKPIRDFINEVKAKDKKP
jgi:hypothetical protein